ncbi:lipopolysaccharide assembly protein LapA domain-containing protein [soil metagenome]
MTESLPPETTEPVEPDVAAERVERAERPQPAGINSKGGVKRTRVSALWVGLVAAALLTILLLIFIAQNSDAVAINFLWWDGKLSLAVALLLSAVIGILLVAIPGSLRIIQLRRALLKNQKL